MESAPNHAFSESLLAAMPQLREKPRLGFSSKNPALHQVHEVCNSTTALGLRAALHLERIRSRYTGKERDVESGNDYFETRYYSSATGRFTSSDSYNIIFEMLKGKNDSEQFEILTQYLSNPQSLNKYSYAVNRPLILTDPDGRREQNDNDKNAIAKLKSESDKAGAAGDTELQHALLGSVTELSAAIAAVPNGAKDPANIGAVEWAIWQIGQAQWGKNYPVDNGVTASIGSGQSRCSTLAATAYGYGAGVGYGGSGMPIGGRSLSALFLRNNVLSANTLASGDNLPHLQIVGSANLGSIVAFARQDRAGHSGISIGGGAMVYAGSANAKVQTIKYVTGSVGSAARFRDYKP